MAVLVAGGMLIVLAVVSQSIGNLKCNLEILGQQKRRLA